MKKLILISILISSIILPSQLSADALSKTSETLDELKSKVKKITLDNGLRVIMYKRGFAPVFAGAVSVGVGGVDEPTGKTGISHMLEHMAFKGTTRLGTKNYREEKKLLKELEVLMQKDSRVADLTDKEKEEVKGIRERLDEIWDTQSFDKAYNSRGGTSQNATTSIDITNYFVEFPKNAFEFWVWMESERILDPVYRQFYKERDVVLEERRMRTDDNPTGKLYETLISNSFSIHPYRNPVIGHSQDVSKLTATETREFQKKYYQPSNIVVSLVGDIDFEKDLALVKRYFGKLKKGAEPPPRTRAKELEQLGEKNVSIRFKALPSSLVAYKKPVFPHKDDASLTVMSEILTGGSVSRLYKKFVKEDRIATDISYFEAPGSRYDNLLVFSLKPKLPLTNNKFISEFDKMIEKFKKDDISDDEMLIAKRDIAVSTISDLDSNLSLAKSFAYAEIVYGDWEATLDWCQQAFDVTKEDVRRVAKEYLLPKNRTIARLETKQ